LSEASGKEAESKITMEIGEIQKGGKPAGVEEKEPL